MPHLLLQKSHRTSKARDHVAQLDRRLKTWSKEDLDLLLHKGHMIQRQLTFGSNRACATVRQVHVRRKVRAALWLVTEQERGGLLPLDSVVSSHCSTSKTVCDVLQEKHPSAQPPSPSAIYDFSEPIIEPHPVQFDQINGPLIRATMLRMGGSAGPSSIDAAGWKHLCMSFCSHSSDLCDAIASCDEVFTVVHIDRVQHLLGHLNSIECSIQFTVEVENDGELPFLDVNVYRKSDGSVNTSVYRKPTHTDRYLDFSSHHPFSHKRAVVRTLSSRASTHSSSQRDQIKETNRVTSALRLTGYPRSFIQSSQSPRTVPPSSTPEYRACAVIPYVHGVSECIRRILTPLQIRVCYKPFQTFRQLLSQPKDRVPELQRSGVVYKIPCANCPMVYIGQTGRRLCKRLSEHKSQESSQNSSFQFFCPG